MSVSYREAKTRLKGLSGAEQEAFLARLNAHRRALGQAGQPWSLAALMAWAAGILVFAASAADGGRDLRLLALGGAFILVGWGFEMMAANKKRAYERAHPFEG